VLEYLYFPGCTLKHSSAMDMEKTTLMSAAELGITLKELEDWQCCGAVYPLNDDELITLLSPARTLYQAGEKPVVSLCSACHHVLKRTKERLTNDKDARDKLSWQLEEKHPERIKNAKAMHFLEVLRDELGWEALKEKIKTPLEGRRVAAYYGCLLLRPADEMGFDNPERPQIMEDFLQALGADVVKYRFGNKCCGSYLAVADEQVMEDASKTIVEMALEAGAEELITACPLCRYNLEKTPEVKEGKIKVSYFSELLAETLNLELQEVK